jgi:thiamine biosynthesis lipoprotein ApbE
MRTLQRKRKREREGSTDVDSDSENKSPTDERRSRKTRRSLSKANSNTSADFSDIKELLAKGEQQRLESSKQMAEILRESTRVYEKTSEKYLEVLTQLVRN